MSAASPHVRSLSAVLVDMPVRVARYQSGAVFGPRRLPDFELFWLLSGGVTRAYETPWGSSGRAELLPGRLNLAVPGTVDTYVFDPAVVSTHAFVHFRLADPGDAETGGRLGPTMHWPSVVDLRTHPTLTALCQYGLDLAVDQTEVALERTQHCAALMLDMIVRGTSAHGLEIDPRLDALVEHVATRWAGEGICVISGQQLAKAVGLSRGHLSLMITRHFGCGPAEMLEMVRLAHAAVTLQRSNTTVAEVAAECGFANPFHFSRRFKHQYGQPPSTFRHDEARADPYAPLRERQLMGVAHRLLRVRTWS